MSRIKEGLSCKFRNQKEDFESKGSKVDLGKTKVMINGGISQLGMSNCETDPCGVCSLRVKAK